MNEKQFNKLFPIGSPVKYHPVIGQPEFWETETRSTAWALASGHVVVQIKGRTGSVSIAAIERGTTQLAHDAGDSAVSTSSFHASAESTSQSDAVPTQRV